MMNPMALMKMKPLLQGFASRHPKFLQFFNVMMQQGISADSVVEITIKTPEGRVYTSNMKVSPEDIELFHSLQKMK